MPTSSPLSTPSPQLAAWQQVVSLASAQLPGPHTPLTHSAPTVQALAAGHVAPQAPPQSTPRSSWLRRPSRQEALQRPSAPQLSLAQSLLELQAVPFGQPAHSPPQSVSSSVPSRTPLSQAAGVQRASDAGQPRPASQSTALRQRAPTSQRAAQVPPQSTSASAPLTAPSLQLGCAQQPSLHDPVAQSASPAQRPSAHAGPASTSPLPDPAQAPSSHAPSGEQAAPSHVGLWPAAPGAPPTGPGRSPATRSGSNSSDESVQAPLHQKKAATHAQPARRQPVDIQLDGMRGGAAGARGMMGASLARDGVVRSGGCSTTSDQCSPALPLRHGVDSCLCCKVSPVKHIGPIRGRDHARPTRIGRESRPASTARRPHTRSGLAEVSFSEVRASRPTRRRSS